MKYVLIDQDIVPKEKAGIDFDDRGYHFGDGIYEVIRIYNGKPFTINQHLDRLYESAKKLDIPLSTTRETFTELINELIIKNTIETGIVYIQLTRGLQPRNHLYQREISPVLTGFAENLERKDELLANGVDLWLTKDIRWLRCDIKTINLLGNIMAKREAADHNCHEAIMHRDGTVTEGSSSNLFLIKDSTLYTHPATNFILNGITRQVVIKLAKEAGLHVVEEAFPTDVLAIADEAFITSTTMEVTPVRSITGDVSATLEIGPITRQLQEAFKQLLP
ncbi:D-amino-acid transaminase [Alkalihalophilus marmarensis]|jgi:D-alanine transaminase|uniref:D-alanine aminotransferase n=1 Tax=Alkalihalophilus marmarensis DSM 21297 TaxID=1188261 RepID=U6SQ60_9BACI|nr:D-amino-acid transaminase [Alkalihalophilus marmarensis]ERN53040.1 D-alanine aminotransferase [Alkalihalophilus marmarensis DSM 21297]MCM3489035.1 D-amino-acid transaminase [Alkalihalophilus marmarensis]